MTCPLCRRRVWPLWAIVALSLTMLAVDLAKTGFTFTAGRWYERAANSKAIVAQWERITDGAWKREAQREIVPEKGKRTVKP